MTNSNKSRVDIAVALSTIGKAQSETGQPAALFTAFDQYCADRFDHRLFTILEWAPDKNDVERLHSSRPAEYPLLGRKAMGPTEWGALVLKGGQSWIGRNANDIYWAFPDHELIASLGCASCINAPVLWDGKVLGVASVLGVESQYDDGDLAGLVAIAPLLVPGFLARSR